MDFIANRDEQNRQMLKALGIKHVRELFRAVPDALYCAEVSKEDGLSEFEALRWMENIASDNQFLTHESYLGAGAYEHHVPALVGAVCSKSEFLTAYTPYQAEASQGMLQAIFEYQAAICALTGMDAANASVYDGASACAEAVLMALRQLSERSKVIVAGTLNPHYKAVILQYIGDQEVDIETVSYDHNGALDRAQLEASLDEKTAAVLIQSPNFFGVIEQVQEIMALAKRNGSIGILCANPLSYGLLHAAADLGADIAVGDSQPLGLHLQFGGPYAGYIAVRQPLLRQLPGRIVGETVDSRGQRGFVLTLQAREQHIRREKATSNICTNQALAALATLTAALWYGKKGIRELALTCYQRTAYLREKLEQLEGVHLMSQLPVFNEFVIQFDRPIRDVQKAFRRKKIEPGVSLKHLFPSLKNALLVSVTETKSRADLDRYVEVMRACLGGEDA